MHDDRLARAGDTAVVLLCFAVLVAYAMGWLQ